LGGGLVAVVGFSGCEAGCDDEIVDRAIQSLDSHQGCEGPPDCVILSDFCGELPGGVCGQTTMNREGRESAKWLAIEKELGECVPTECGDCEAGRLPTCINGACNGTLQ
jgi:hypothetical protein